MSADDYIDLYRKCQDLTDNVVKEWQAIGLDAVICPIFGVVAPKHEKTVEVITSLGFSVLFNVLRFPAGVVPVGIMQDDEPVYQDRLNDPATFAAKVCMQTAQGLPYGLQVVALPYKDEIALNLMKDLENVFRFHNFAL